jgi:long-chain-alcohol oxidase
MESHEHIDGYLGAPLTTVCKAFEQGPRYDGYGAKVECPSAHPGLLAAGLQWTTPEQYKERLLKLRSAAFLIAIQRDRGEGSVRLGRDGYNPKIEYDE